MNNIESNICQAIDIIVQRAIAQADYDKTIQATVIECVDATIGKYKVKYQDSTFYAYSSSSDVIYGTNAAVYVLVPAGDMSKDKTILGAVKKLGTNYVVSNEMSDRYDIIGENCIRNEGNDFRMSSYYPGGYVKTLYSKDPAINNVISITPNSLEEYIKNSQYMLCAAQFRTALPAEQQSNGNYGLLIRLDFADNSAGDEPREVTREYVIDVNKMQGNPYRLLNKTRQYGIFNIDGANFLRINDISIFCYGFPNQKAGQPEDIFVSDIELCAVEPISMDDLNGYGLSFITPQGRYFDETHLSTDTLDIKAQVKVKGNVVSTDDQRVDFYWFIEDVTINSESSYYNQYGGFGWKCLNEFNVISAEGETDRTTVQWIPATDTLTIEKQFLYAEKTTIKCVAIYNDALISKTIVISRLDAEWHVAIGSDMGVQFYFDNGYPTLTCYVNGEDKPDDFIYSWALISNGVDFNSIAETPDVNERYAAAVADLKQLEADIAAEKVLASANEQRLTELKKTVEDYNYIQRVDRNKIHNFAIKSITNFCEFKCTVYNNNNQCIGTASIVLKNDLTAEGTWSLVIHDASQVYKYNEYGVSPAEVSNIDNYIIKNLTFTLYDNLGKAISEDSIAADNIHWYMPLNYTMIKPALDESYVDDEDLGVRIYTGVRSLPYKIASSYNVNNQDNDIALTVEYKDILLTAKTNLIFTKEGNAGTNGSEYYCRIIPNVSDLQQFVEPPMITYDNQTKRYILNFNPVNAAVPFKVQLWHNSTMIFSDTKGGGLSSEGKPVTVAWSVLRNKYTSDKYDNTSFTIDQNSGTLTCGDFNVDSPANIIKVTVTHDGVTYYTTLPLITAVVQNSTYAISQVPNSGFNSVVYSSDGKQPVYNTAYPFEVIILQQIGEYIEDVSLKTETYAVDYAWKVCGSIIEQKQVVNRKNLIEYNTIISEELNKNQKEYRAVDTFDGLCVNNAIECTITRGGAFLAKIHMPVHMMLNRYGNSAINGWDGNSVEIDNEGGVILSPQMGAGKKENDNSFTGVVMGKVRDGENPEEVGLFGYHHGERSIFLDAETGKAEFGIETGSRIIIDPSTGKAQIYSGNYSTDKKTGMMIDFSTPEIRFGSGNFIVDKDGKLTAKGEGSSLAGWHFDNDSLYSMNGYSFEIYGEGAPNANAYPPAKYQYKYYLDYKNNVIYYCDGTKWSIVNADNLDYNKTDSSNTRLSNIPFRRYVNGDDVKDNRLAIGDTFSVTQDGYVRMSEASIGDGIERIYIGHSTPIGGGYQDSALYSGSKSSLLADSSGFYLGTDGLAIGYLNELTAPDGSKTYVSNFQVTEDGNLFARGQIYAETGFIGDMTEGWTIDSDSIWNGKSDYDDNVNNGMYIGTDAIGFGSGTGHGYFRDDGEFKLAGGKIVFDGDKLSLVNVAMDLNYIYIDDSTTLAARFQATESGILSQVEKTYATQKYASEIEHKADGISSTVTLLSGTVDAQASEISQNAGEIALRVKKGTPGQPYEVCSEINASQDKIYLRSNRLVVESSNFTLDEQGNATFSGTVTSDKVYVKNVLYMDRPDGSRKNVLDITTGASTVVTTLAVGIGCDVIDIRGECWSTSFMGGGCSDGTVRNIIGCTNNTGNRNVAFLGSVAGGLNVNGQWGNEDGSYSTRTISVPSSDIRLKTNIKDSKVNALSIINQIKMREFDWTEANRGHQKIGFVADELELIDEKLAMGGGEDEEGNMLVKSVDTFYLLGYVVKAMQEMQAEIQELKGELAKWKATT